LIIKREREKEKELLKREREITHLADVLSFEIII
tara:strand:+ start:1143 stop:1244 length:102 start_codon:yes stop_codon:yes gene_type:complete